MATRCARADAAAFRNHGIAISIVSESEDPLRLEGVGTPENGSAPRSPGLRVPSAAVVPGLTDRSEGGKESHHAGASQSHSTKTEPGGRARRLRLRRRHLRAPT